MGKLGRFASRDATRGFIPSRRCSDSKKEDQPVAVYDGVDYVVNINPEGGHIEIYKRPTPLRRVTTDSDAELPLNERLREINRRNAEFWARRKEDDK